MMERAFRSLQVQLAIRLALVYVAASVIAIGVLAYRAYDAAGSLNDRELSLRADDLAGLVAADDAGKARLELPANLVEGYSATDTDIFAVRAKDGHVLAASPADFGKIVSGWPPPGDDPVYFRLQDIGTKSRAYYGLSVALASAAGPVWVTVAHAETEALVTSVMMDFVQDVAWVIPVFIALTLAIGIFVIRRGLQPVREASQMAMRIGPGSTSIRLPEGDLPSEIAPLVGAMNRALDRLEQGFLVQRQFTANAAHELRTPLAIVTVALESMKGGAELEKLKGDVARMNRLVEQLLGVARLDAIGLDVSGAVDLNATAASVVTTLAPWAIAKGRRLGFSGAGGPITVKGNAHAIEDAIRNLVENAVAHSPAGEEVTVEVRSDGTVSVRDQGPGVPIGDREHIFERFWRGKKAGTQGAGLGLAIVREIMRAHDGIATVGDNPGGGAIFTLAFKLADQAMGPASGL